jgi:hypothetical protein
MPAEAHYLDLLGEFVVHLSQEITSSITHWDRPATRLLLGLYDLFSDANSVLSKCFVNLNAFQQEDHIGWKVHWIHESGKNLSELLEVLTRLTNWVEDLKRITVLKIWTSELEQRWDYINDNDYGYSAGENAIEHWNEIINAYRSSLQATASPNPEYFPASEITSEISASLHKLDSDFASSRESLRTFALAHLQVADFF